MLAIPTYLYFPKSKNILYNPLHYWSIFLENSFSPFLTYLNWIPSFRSSSEVTFLQKAFLSLTLALEPSLLGVRVSLSKKRFVPLDHLSILESYLTVNLTNIQPLNTNNLLVVNAHYFWHSANQSSDVCRTKSEEGRETKNRKRRRKLREGRWKGSGESEGKGKRVRRERGTEKAEKGEKLRSSMRKNLYMARGHITTESPVHFHLENADACGLLFSGQCVSLNPSTWAIQTH